MSTNILPPHFFGKTSIRAKLAINAAITVGLALIVAATVLVSSANVERATRSDRLADRVIKDVSDLNSLSYAYLLLKDERPRVQWQLKHASLGRALSGHDAGSRQEEAVFARMRSNHEQMKRLFDLVSERVGRNQARTGDASSPYDELNEGLTAQLMARAEMMASDAALLGVETSRYVDRVGRTSLILVSISTIVLILSSAVMATLLGKTIGSSIGVLERGTERIAAGDLMHRVDTGSRDEIGRLSAAFNDMAAKLAASYRRLAEEVDERREAQAALQKAHDVLESRVEERTAHLAERTRQLEETNNELESFAYTISHDLRAPLRAINTFAHMLSEQGGPSLDDEGKRRLGVIEANALRMGRLIDDLLTFSRAGRTGLNVTPIDMNGLVAEVLESLKSGRDPVTVVAGDLPAAMGDPALIRQVLVNLLSNAIKFSRNSPDPRIEVGSLDKSGESVYFIRDNGVGFDMKYYDRLFRVFERLVSEAEFEGTGVGLAIVHRLVTRHEGRAWAEAKPGEGATFYFTLPAKE